MIKPTTAPAGDRGEPTTHGVGAPLRRSPAHRLHAAMGGAFERRHGWEVPALYGSVDLELEALRTSLGYADVTARGKVQLNGTLDALIARLIAGSCDPLSTAPLAGGGRLARVARDWALALAQPGGEKAVLRELDAAPGDALVTDVTSAWSGTLVAGPRLEDFLARSITIDPRELTSGRCAATTWARIPAVLVPVDAETPAIEIYVSADYGRYSWETVRFLGGRLGASAAGWRALDAWGWR